MNYEIREMSQEEFLPIWNLHAEKIFDDHSQIFRVFDWLDHQEKEKAKDLRKFIAEAYQLRLGVFVGGQCVGWSVGHQESAETYYMRNSAVLPEYRRQGLYTALMHKTTEILKEKGFQKIYSRHCATNNAVIIPKLTAGFVITSMEISDMFGVLVHLTYFPKELRRKIMNFRVGDLKPDEEIKKCLKI